MSENSNTPFIHPSSYIDEDVVLGAGTKVWHFCHLLSGTRIGENCVLGQNVMAGPDVTIGNNCRVQNNVSLYKGVTLEDDVFCGPSMVFTNVLNPRAFVQRKEEFAKTPVRRGATIGANATVVCGHTIGRYAMIGAGAVVTTDVPDHALMLGVPARQAGWVCRCGEVLDFSSGVEATCHRCGAAYLREGEGIREAE